jgi:NAD(P)-dependent dehydrogenase (short-subunit alcohol dehydrogenase family)
MKQVVLITGASSGIGRATAELLSTRTSGCAHPFASRQNPPVFNYPNLRLARVALPHRGTLKASLAIVRQSSSKSFSIGRPHK